MRVSIITIGSQVRILTAGALQYRVGTVRSLKTYADAHGLRRIAHVHMGVGRGKQTFALTEIESVR